MKESALLIIDVQVGIIDGFKAYRGNDVLSRINTYDQGKTR
jgi:hypothetical protein